VLIMPGKKYKCDSLSEDIQKELIALHNQGYSFRYLEKWLEDKGFKILQKQIQNWLEYRLTGIKAIDNEKIKSEEYKEKIDRDTQANPIIDNPKDLEKIRKDWGIPDIEMLDDNPELAIGASQKLAYDLFISVGILCKNRLNLYQQGNAKFPIEQIKALKLIYEIYAPLMGINELVSPNAAIKSLESYGYNLEGLKKANDETTN